MVKVKIDREEYLELKRKAKRWDKFVKILDKWYNQEIEFGKVSDIILAGVVGGIVGFCVGLWFASRFEFRLPMRKRSPEQPK